MIERVQNLWRSEERSAGAEHGLLPVQIEVLGYLARCNRFSDTPSAVTRYLGVTKGTASQTIQRLRERQLVEAVPDESDRRALHLSLSKDGRQVLRSLRPPETMVRAVESLSRSQIEGLTEGLDALLLELQRQQERAGFGVCETCRYHRVEGERPFCGLLEERLSKSDGLKLCAEHEPPS